ncbi:MAG: glutathione peroxidase [Microbacteriaceae bacterium]|nr:glutathione peroxidase [Microbacteriaceae bacterium]
MAATEDLYDIPVTTIDGKETTLADYRGKVVMIVNVASKCGLTPQYEQLEALQREYGPRGFTVLGFPCNQFMGQEPGSNEEILDYCSTTWGVTFPMYAKVKVNGPGLHPLYKALKRTKDEHGLGGLVAWNFEKFLVAPDGTVRRFRPPTKPDDPAIVGAIESALETVSA